MEVEIHRHGAEFQGQYYEESLWAWKEHFLFLWKPKAADQSRFHSPSKRHVSEHSPAPGSRQGAETAFSKSVPWLAVGEHTLNPALSVWESLGRQHNLKNFKSRRTRANTKTSQQEDNRRQQAHQTSWQLLLIIIINNNSYYAVSIEILCSGLS